MSLDLMNALLAVYKGELKRQEPMAKHTTFKVGGPCDFYVKPASMEDLRIAVAFLSTQGVPLTIAGGGSNLLVADDGVKGAVITLSGIKEKITHKVKGHGVTVRVPAGTLTSKLCSFAAEKGFSGLTFATGIPGTMGGALAMNASTEPSGWETVVKEIEVVERSGKVKTFSADALSFSYRNLAIGGENRLCGGFPIIVSVTLHLSKGDAAGLLKARDEKLKRRKASQPVNLPSPGCFFKNPAGGPPAGQLIDELGFKGQRQGGAMVSEVHANYIVNTGDATAEDILTLARRIQDEAQRVRGISLQEEVTLVGNHP